MGAELVRFGVAMDADLLAQFDARVAARGYATRSEALRDLVRADLSAERIEGGAPAAATLTIVYDHHVRELGEKLTELQHGLGDAVVSTLHIHLDHDHCLEVIVMRGPADRLQQAADRVMATKGVEHGSLVMTAMPTAVEDPHAHAHAHGETDAVAAPHGHPHAHTHSDGGHAHVHVPPLLVRPEHVPGRSSRLKPRHKG